MLLLMFYATSLKLNSQPCMETQLTLELTFNSNKDCNYNKKSTSASVSKRSGALLYYYKVTINNRA